MKFYIDCEWNEYRGELISMALVGENGREWYEVLGCPSPKPWVAEHVIPKLMKAPISLAEMRKSLKRFLLSYKDIHIISDWPEDLARFCELIVTGPGQMLYFDRFFLEYRRDLDSGRSAIPHNALADAQAIAHAAMSIAAVTCS